MMIHVVCNIDEAYVRQCDIMLHSLFASNSSELFTIHIINNGISESARQILLRRAVPSKRAIVFHNVPHSAIAQFPIFRHDHLSLAAYMRIFMPSLLPQDIDKALYLDCDMLIVGNIAELWNTDISGYAVAAVEERPPYDGARGPGRLGYSEQLSYFNSGVMLVNLAMWRAIDVQGQSLAFIAEHPDRIVLHDQDVLNVVLAGRCKFVSIRWNLMDFFLFKQPDIQARRRRDLTDSLRNPAVLHYTNRRKPWNHNCENPYGDMYLRVAEHLGWQMVDMRTRVHKILRRVFYAIIFKKSKYVSRGSVADSAEVFFQMLAQ